MAGGLAAGLANGIQNGLQLVNQSNYYNGLNEHRERLDELKAQQLANKESAGGKGVNFDEFDKVAGQIFRPSGNNPASAPAKQLPSLVTPGAPMIPDAAISGNAPAAYQAGSLASVQKPASAQSATQDQPEEPLNPRHEIVKQMMFGDLANDPDKLNAINAAAVMSGVGKEVTPWLESLYKAKKTGLFDAAMDLKRGNVDGAIENLKRGGINLQDRPVKVNPDDPNNGQWKVNIPGTGEQTIDIDNWATSVLDPEKYAKFTLDRQDTANKGKVADAQVKNLNATSDKNTAMAKAYASGSLGSAGRPGGPNKAPRVVKTVETNQGMVAVMSDGSQNILKDADGNPLYGTSGQRTAASLIGKTLNQFGDNGDIAGKVNSLAGQLQGGRPQAPARINALPDGAKQIGTSNGKPVYEVNGRRFVAE